MFRLNGIVAGAIALSMVSAANADTLTGQYVGSLDQQVALTVQGWVVGPSNNLVTRAFNWNRNDLPAGPGVDNTIPAAFLGYCIDINQSVTAGVPHTYNVVTPAAYGLNANQILLLSRLFGEYEDDSLSSSVTAAAFQCAVYEIQYDGAGGAANTSAGNFVIQASSIAVKIIADMWLANITSPGYAGATAPVAILESGTVQDQIVRVPTPGTATVGLVGAGLLARRRRRA